ncbi:MAG TPA: polysaccharide biosynthesis/export family protein [Cytophagaceae bacterium]|jgi:polysaccharide export outer membrane protein|nr:polysaccharide biosynthesis/export family protein [Cytophagaceae bacterium]
MFKKILLLALSGVLVASCVAPKKLRYMIDLSVDTASTAVVDSSYTYRLKPADVLYIKVVSSTDSKMELFNQSLTANQMTNIQGQSNLLVGNQIDQFGNIEMPMVGQIQLSGLTLKEAELKVNQKMSEYLKYVTVSLKLMSFRVSVLGEVNDPGVKQIDRAKVTILDALAYAGDMSDLANRKKVRLIRREKDRNKVYTVDMSSVKMLSSDYYYLRPDDVIYVEPLRYKTVKVSSSTLTILVSLFSISLSIFAILRK